MDAKSEVGGCLKQNQYLKSIICVALAVAAFVGWLHFSEDSLNFDESSTLSKASERVFEKEFGDTPVSKPVRPLEAGVSRADARGAAASPSRESRLSHVFSQAELVEVFVQKSADEQIMARWSLFQMQADDPELWVFQEVWNEGQEDFEYFAAKAGELLLEVHDEEERQAIQAFVQEMGGEFRPVEEFPNLFTLEFDPANLQLYAELFSDLQDFVGQPSQVQPNYMVRLDL